MSPTPEPGPTGLPEPRADAASLLAFVAVAREGTVGGAAARLGRAQPSISSRIAALERAWGTRLFRRRSRGMSLTPEGARLLPQAEAVLRGMLELDRAAGLPVAPPDEVRVGAGDALGRELLPRALAALLGKNPELNVRIVEGPGPRLLGALRSGEIDVALVVREGSPPDGEELDWRPLVETPVDLLVGPGTRMPKGDTVPVERLRTQRLITLQSGSSFRRHLEAAFDARGIPFRPAIEVGNLSLVRRFVAAGLGVAPVPAIAFGESRSRSRVARLRLGRIRRVAYASVTRSGVALPSSCRELLMRLR